MAYNIMIQGSMSNAGKSLFVAGLCRILRQDGYKVAPFKSQNMALNSYVTEDGLEMGRAQVMQAEAAKIKPQVEMNPILLKPSSDMGSQVIVNGKARGDMQAKEYFCHKKKLIPAILEAYHKLEQEYDIIVIEGAGSPAEINLKAEDIVNMGLAELLDAPVLLIGDIDRGGVFAQLYGTVALLEEAERKRIKGLVINKFRGDEAILKPGIAMLEELCQIPVAAVLPFMKLALDDEDSLSDRLQNSGCTMGSAGSTLIDIAVIRLPHTSNFTDFNPLSDFSSRVALRYVERPEMLGHPDLLIIPGTKNTIKDMKTIRENGMEAAICCYVATGGLLLGICGGFQMLGKKIRDSHGVEGLGSIDGMGLLPLETDFLAKKVTKQVRGVLVSNERNKEKSLLMPVNLQGSDENKAPVWEDIKPASFAGYEIHMGQSKNVSDEPLHPFVRMEGGEEAGCIRANIAGTYVHGLFESREVLQSLFSLLCDRRYGKHAGYKKMLWQDAKKRDYQAYKEEQYERLAETMRKHLNMDFIYDTIGIEKK